MEHSDMTHSCPARRRSGKHKVRRLSIFWRWKGDGHLAVAERDYPVDMTNGHPAADSAGEGPDSLGTALRTLRPIEEKVVRLSYGIGCQRAHSAAEVAAEFGVGTDVVEAILEEAEQRLAERGVPRDQLQQSSPPVSCSRHHCRTRSAEGD
ncbi:MAG: hypothetical protein ABSH24_28975 [Bryobacteraceae bacterium]|jgi:DNA-directed RNA polymerase specialized sigma24 family protein